MTKEPDRIKEILDRLARRISRVTVTGGASQSTTGARHATDREKAVAKAALNSYILEETLKLIGDNEDSSELPLSIEKDVLVRNSFKNELRTATRKKWSNK